RAGPPGAGEGADVVDPAAGAHHGAVAGAAVDRLPEGVAQHVSHHHRHDEAAGAGLARLAIAGAALRLTLLLASVSRRLGDELRLAFGERLLAGHPALNRRAFLDAGEELRLRRQ